MNENESKPKTKPKYKFTPEDYKKAGIAKAQNASLRNAVYGQLKMKLMEDIKRGHTAYYTEFMDKFLKIALKDPESKAGQMLAGTIFQENMLAVLDEAHDKEVAKDQDFTRYQLIKDFFRQQRDVILETNHRRKIIACCSRRAGKTDLASGAICYASIIPDSRIIYINLTFSNAIRQIWDNIFKRVELSSITITKSSKSEGTIEFSNGSSVRIMGNPNNAEIEKLRGESKVSLIVIDEFFHQRNMQYALDEVISPLMADRTDSTLLCMGTPPRIPHTFGESCWNENGWCKFHWTMFENPYIPEPRKYLDELCRSKGITVDSPFIQREFYGKIGYYDTEAMVFKDRKTFNEYDYSFKFTDIAIGVDYGFRDYNSIVTLVYDKDKHESYVIDEDKFNRAGVSDIVARLQVQYDRAKDLCIKHHVDISDHIKIFCDTNEESITYDMVAKYHLPCYNCYKYDRVYAIEMLSEELRTGRMKIRQGGILDCEMEQIIYQRDPETDAICNEIDEEMGIHPESTMALLYASRRAFFDMDYNISFKETEPPTSYYTHDETGTITGFIEEKGQQEDSGIVG